ncbi:hypothetical protein N7455_001748 [Penicillium solitum]|uniref:Uncharacterized protein n=1 Tax=Penicillium crustosum TaxID=36656 RepID=A0A9P5G9H9_PENCR|nr:hypothetical protein PCG10_004061 [Penicillium crustosum]KAJ5695346.1 hypothetical protein N7536_005758 [Penicillium majusculum]KAJ5878283.1 hypothetical protein N7455_001748 [Penicillium solitum]KAJ5957280.1 hypothetical protein N7501_011559 [Penicillium viridicatum]
MPATPKYQNRPKASTESANQERTGISAPKQANQKPANRTPPPEHQHRHTEPPDASGSLLGNFPLEEPSPTPSRSPSAAPRAPEPAQDVEPSRSDESVAEEPHEQQLQTELHAVAPRDIDLDVRQENILMRPRKRKAREDPDFLTYLAMELQEENDQLEMLAAFSTALINTKPPQPRPHRADLPSKPETWKQMVRHPLEAEFKAAATKEVTAQRLFFSQKEQEEWTNKEITRTSKISTY